MSMTENEQTFEPDCATGSLIVEECLKTLDPFHASSVTTLTIITGGICLLKSDIKNKTY